MTDDKEIVYSVIITITLPGQSGETSLHLALGPADPLPTADGPERLLQDCTLAELQQFADALESELWQEYLDATLVDLVVDDTLTIEFEYADEQGNEAPSSALLLDHVVLFPEQANNIEDRLSDASFPEEVADQVEFADNGGEIDAHGTESKTDDDAIDARLPDLDASEPAAELPEIQETEDSSEDQATAVAQIAADSEDVTSDQPAVLGDEPVVTVAEPELVHEEREASGEPDIRAPAVRPRVRILGRRRPLGHGTPSAVDILINETAFRDAQAHAISSPSREVAGVLIGPPPEKQPDARYVVHISDMIIAKHTRMQGASVTYTPESWRYVNDRLAEMYPDDTAVIVGWYHTHPGFGIFLSGMDRFIHHNFFTQIWHVALVLDPLARKSGFFSWDRSKTQVDAYDFPWPNWAADSW